MDTYDRAFLVHADNVGSKQFMDIRAVSGEPEAARWGGGSGVGFPPPPPALPPFFARL